MKFKKLSNLIREKFFNRVNKAKKKNISESISSSNHRQKLKYSFMTFIRGSLIVLISVLIIYGVVQAGTITPPSGTPTAKFYSLSEIYEFITNNTTATEGGHDFTFSDSLAGTSHTLTEIYNALANLISADKVKLGTTYLGTVGTLVPSGGDATTADVLIGKTFFGDSQTDWTLKTGIYDATNLTTTTVKKGITFAVSSTGAYSGYPGTGWVPNSSGDGSTALNQTNCEAAYSADNYRWQWFEDVNGDGDTTDPEDGMCVLMCVGDGCTNTANYSNDGYPAALSWNGAEQVDTDNLYDNTWIGDWTCAGNFPTGTVVWHSYPADPSGTIALATADCLDGKRDLLPIVDESSSDSRIVYSGTATAGDAATLTDSGAAWPDNAWVNQKVKIFSGTSVDSEGIIATSTATTLEVASWSAGNPSNDSQYGIIYIKPNDSGADGYNGPLTAEVLNNWKGTRLPTHTDFFDVCGSGSSDKTIGNYGSQIGRTDEYLNEANDSVWEWLSEQHYIYSARIAGNDACSAFNYYGAANDGGFRAVFRP